MVTVSHARAILAALAVADALGLPLELQGVGPRGEWLGDPAALKPLILGGRAVYSDDTEQTLILAESMVESCGFNPVDFAERLAKKARTWDPVRNYGIGVSEVIEAVRKGVDWRIAARRAWGGRGSFGNAGAVRVPPIVLFYETREAVEAMAVAQAMVTHVHPVGVEGARLQAIALYELMRGLDPSELPRLLARETMLEEYREKLEVIPELLDANPERVARVLGNGAAAHESIPAAVYIVVRSEGDPARSIAYAASLGGDVDSIAALAASLSAAANPEAVENNAVIQGVLRVLESSDDVLGYGERVVKAARRCRDTLL